MWVLKERVFNSGILSMVGKTAPLPTHFSLNLEISKDYWSRVLSLTRSKALPSSQEPVGVTQATPVIGG